MEDFYKSILPALLFFLLGFIITLVSSKIIKNLLAKIVSRTRSDTDDYIALIIVETINPLGLIISGTLAWNLLEINEALEVLDMTILGLAKFAGLILIVRLLNRILLKIIQRWGNRINDKSVSNMVRSLSPMARAIIWCIGFIFYLQNMGVQMAAIWALLSAGGIGAGLALKEPVQEFFEYITILLDKPFQSGQFIHIDDIWAKVERVGVRSTRLRSLNGEIIVMSNSRLTNGVISNYAEMEKRRLVHRLGVVYETPYNQMKEIPNMIKNIVNSTSNAVFDRCHFVEFGSSSLDFEVVYYIPTSDYSLAMSAQQEINLKIMKEFEAENISFAFPTQTIQITNQ